MFFSKFSEVSEKPFRKSGNCSKNLECTFLKVSDFSLKQSWQIFRGFSVNFSSQAIMMHNANKILLN